MTGKNEGNWFDDDPEWAALRRRVDKKAAPPIEQDIVVPKPKPKTAGSLESAVASRSRQPEDKRQILVNITLPEVRIPKIKLPKSLPRKVWLGGALAGGAVIALISLTVMFKHRTQGGKSSPADTQAVLSDKAAKPDFKVILPEGKETELENSKVAYDPAKKVASFRDKIGIADITVSQQPLPDVFKSDPEKQLETIATNFSATELIVSSNPKAYLGTSVKGPQTVIFYKYDVLVFIQSTKQISKADWTDYIRSLR